MRNNLGVMANNSGAVADLLGDGVAVLSNDVLALLDVGGVHDGVVDLVANLSGHLAALSVNLLLALGAARVSSMSSLSLSFNIPLSISMTMGDDLGVMTNNSGAVADLLGDGVAVLSN